MHIDTNGITLGDRVRDTVTGVEGIAAGFHQYMTGCARVSIQPRADKDNKVPDAISCDVITTELIESGDVRPVDRSKGGPRNDPHSRV